MLRYEPRRVLLSRLSVRDIYVYVYMASSERNSRTWLLKRPNIPLCTIYTNRAQLHLPCLRLTLIDES